LSSAQSTKIAIFSKILVSIVLSARQAMYSKCATVPPKRIGSHSNYKTKTYGAYDEKTVNKTYN
jgi:hypothetical protein